MSTAPSPASGWSFSRWASSTISTARSPFSARGAKWTFQKVHPNCEAATFFLSDGERYRPPSYYFKHPLDEIAAEAVGLAKSLDARLATLDNQGGWQRLRGKMIVLRALYGFFRKHVRFERVMKGSPGLGLLRLFGGMLLGKSLGEQFNKHTALGDSERFTSIILPFEESHSIELQRMEMCGAAYAYEDVDTGEIRASRSASGGSTTCR